MVDIALDVYFSQKLSLFFHLRRLIMSTFALTHPFQLIPLVNHACQSRENQVLDPPPQV